MQKILTLSNISEISGIIGGKVQKLLSGDRHQIEFFCSFEDFDLLSFNYHEIKDKQDSKITIYLDKENIFFICHEEPMLRVAEELAGTAASDGSLNNEQLLYHFFARLLKNDMAWLENTNSASLIMKMNLFQEKKKILQGKLFLLEKTCEF